MTMPITNLKIDYAKHGLNEVQTRDDYVTIPVDLNDGTPKHESFVYLSYTRNETKGAPITGIDIQYTEEGQPSVIPGWDCVSNADLNHGARGKYIWLYKHTDHDQPPITDIIVSSTAESRRSAPEEYVWLQKDANKEAKGSFVYLYYSIEHSSERPITSIPNDLVEQWKLGKPTEKEICRAQIGADRILVYKQTIDVESRRLPAGAVMSEGLVEKTGSEQNEIHDFAVEIKLKAEVPKSFSAELNSKLGLREEFKTYQYTERDLHVTFEKLVEASTLYFAQVRDIVEVRQLSNNKTLKMLTSYPNVTGYLLETRGALRLAAVHAVEPAQTR